MHACVAVRTQSIGILNGNIEKKQYVLRINMAFSLVPTMSCWLFLHRYSDRDDAGRNKDAFEKSR